MGWLFRLMFIACMLVPGVALATAGYIHDMTGKGTVVGPTGATTALSVGTIIAAGSTIRTEPNSTAILKFEDGQIAVLAADTAFRVSEYNYNKTRVADSRIAVDLIQGGLRFITGVIGATNRNAVRLTAGTATIGIRGTDLSILRNAATQAILAAVNNGAANLSNSVGEVNLGPGSLVGSLVGANVPPVTTAVANILTLFGPGAVALQTLNNAPNIPINTPVVVAASARAAALQAVARANPGNAVIQQQAAAALNEALAAAQAALTAAIQAGAQTSFPASTPQQIQQLQQQLQQEQSGQTGTGTGTGTSGTGTGSGGAGGGSGLTPASPN
jgi:hypothetical protein